MIPETTSGYKQYRGILPIEALDQSEIELVSLRYRRFISKYLASEFSLTVKIADKFLKSIEVLPKCLKCLENKFRHYINKYRANNLLNSTISNIIPRCSVSGILLYNIKGVKWEKWGPIRILEIGVDI